MSVSGRGERTRRLFRLAWPVFVGQIAVMAYGVIDTVMTARSSADDLAALAVGGAIYITIFISGMGVIMALSPVVGQMFGAGQRERIGEEVAQGAWLALALSALGCVLLIWPSPWLSLAGANPALAPRITAYLHGLAFALPASMGFQVFRAFSNAVSRPKLVMIVQLVGLAVKVPLNGVFIFGFEWTTPFGHLRFDPMGAPGCAVATACAMWLMLLVCLGVVRRDPFFRQFGWPQRWPLPRWNALRELLRIGIPMGASMAIEVTGFVFMSLFIARLGSVAVAGHQIVANLVSVLFMAPLAIAIATTTLVAQAIGAGHTRQARDMGWHGVVLAGSLAALMGVAVYFARASILGWYTHDPIIVAAALPLLAWVLVFHVADAIQTVAAFSVRAYKVAMAPMVVYAASMWGVGLGGGYALGFGHVSGAPLSTHGAAGFWIACTLGLVIAAACMLALLARVARRGPA